jgi:F420-non-reducing hydrogenase small subunit
MLRGDDLFGFVCKKGEVIIRQGDRGDTMYIIQSGAVEVSQRQGDREVILALLDRGDFFGEMALIDDEPRSATVTALHRTRLLALTRFSLLARLREDPGVALHLLRTLSQRIEKNNQLLKKCLHGMDSPDPSPDAQGTTNGPGISSVAVSRPAAADASPGSAAVQSRPKPISLVADSAENTCIWVDPGQTIFCQGDHGDTMYIILEGGVEILHSPKGNATTLARLGPDDFLGEMAIITNHPRTAAARASARSKLLPIKQKDFLDRIRHHPELALSLLQTLIKRLRKSSLALTAPKGSIDASTISVPAVLKRIGKVRIALVSLSTCSGCSSTLVDDHGALGAILERAQIIYCPLLMDAHEIGETDIAVVDGLVRHKEDKEKLEEVRNKSRNLVSWGTCASLGGIPAMANQYELEDLIEEAYGRAQDTFAHYLSGSRGVHRSSYRDADLALLRRAVQLDDVVKVDYYIPGCPPRADLLMGLLHELLGEQQAVPRRATVCAECSRKPRKNAVECFWVFPGTEWEANQCFPAQGAFCMGFFTRGGCGAACTKGGLPCWGCRGPSDPALQKIDQGDTIDQVILESLIRRSGLGEDQIKSLMNIIRNRANSAMNFYANHTIDRSRIR